MARVGPGVTRKVWPGDDGIRLLVLGGTAGSVYEPPDVSVLGNPDPMTANNTSGCARLHRPRPGRAVRGRGRR